MKVVILKPRLDVPFKNLGPVPATVNPGPLPPIRQHWQNFVNLLAEDHIKLGHEIIIHEDPLWMFTPEYVKEKGKTTGGWDMLYVPHREWHNFYDTRADRGCGIHYYMQTVIPWRFYVDPLGYAANVSWKEDWQDYADAHMTHTRGLLKTPSHSYVDQYNEYLRSGKSKFDQPPIGNWASPGEYVLFTCQLPHDHTILHHSDISVEEALITTCKAAKEHGLTVVVKGHPVNPGAMEPLKTITRSFTNAIWIDNASLYDVVTKSRAVFTVNSGTGLEALALGKPVFAYGRTEYAPIGGPPIAWSPERYYNVFNEVSPFKAAKAFMFDSAYSQESVRYFFNFWNKHTVSTKENM